MSFRKYFAPSVVALFGATIYVFAQVSVSTDGFDRWYLGNDQADLYVQDLATGNERRITNTVMSEHAPDWSPDGRHIVFSGYRAGIESKHDLYMIASDGSGLTQLTYTPEVFEQHPAWSPNGSQIVFGAGEGQMSHLYIMTVATREVSQVTFSDSAQVSPDWSPDGGYVAYVDIRRERKPVSAEIAMLDLRTGKETRLTNHRGGRGSARDPVWSPDGTRIVYTVGAYDEDRGLNHTPYVVDRFGGQPQRIRTELSLQHPAWSPDGRRIAFIDVRFPETTRIVVMKTDGTNVQTLPDTQANSATYPVWSPDGSQILYLSQRRDPNARSLGSIIVYEDGRTYTTAEPNDLPPLSYATKPLGYAPKDKRWIYTELTVDEFLDLYEETKQRKDK